MRFKHGGRRRRQEFFGGKDEQLRKAWIIAIRRDEGPLFKVKIVHKQCSVAALRYGHAH